jgi:shikimate kinase
MASLLALSFIRRLSPKLDALERRAIGATVTVAGEAVELQSSTEDPSEIPKDMARLKSSAAFGVSPACAFDDLVATRLASLDATPIGQRQILRRFVQHH